MNNKKLLLLKNSKELLKKIKRKKLNIYIQLIQKMF